MTGEGAVKTTNANERLFVAQVVILVEDLWFAPGSTDVVRTSNSYYVSFQLLSAQDEESAYSKAKSWIDSGGFSDSNHDGDGNLTKFKGIGIHQIEEICNLAELPKTAAGTYGVDLAAFNPSEVNAQGAPIIRAKDELEIFRILALTAVRPLT